MVLKDVDSGAEGARSVTSMTEIERRKSISMDEFTRRYPDWEWSAGRRRVLLFDEQDRTWVPMIDAVHGLRYEFDEPGLTPAIEAALAELSRRALEDAKAGRVTYFDPDEDLDD